MTRHHPSCNGEDNAPCLSVVGPSRRVSWREPDDSLDMTEGVTWRYLSGITEHGCSFFECGRQKSTVRILVLT